MTFIQNQTGITPKEFQTDGGGEYVGSETRAVFYKNGVKFTTTAPSSSNQNAIAERVNRTLLESARALMVQASAPKYLWEEAVAFAALCRNLTPHSALKFSAPADVLKLSFFKVKDLRERLRVWGCRCFVHKKDCKLSPTSLPGVFVGIDTIAKAYRVYLPNQRKVILSRDVTFNYNEAEYPLRNFVHAIREGEELIAPGTDGLNSVELANVLLYSSLVDQSIEMPMDGAAFEAKLNTLIKESTHEKKVVEVSGEDFASSFNR